MRIKKRISFALIIIVSLLISITSYSGFYTKKIKLTNEEKIWLNINANNIDIFPDPCAEPLEYFEGNYYKGIASDFLKKIEENIDVKFNIVKLKNWDGALKSVLNGKLGILPIVAITDERKQDFLFTDTYFDLKVVAIAKKNMNLENLKNKTLVLVESYASNSDIENKYKQNNNIIYTENILDALKKVSFGEADLFIIDSLTASASINKYKIMNLKVIYEFTKFYSLGMAVNKNYPILKDILNKGLQSISKKEKEKIYKKWINLNTDNIKKKYYAYISIVIIVFLLILIWNFTLNFAVRSKTKALIITSNVFEKSSEGIAITDKDGFIIKVNKSFQKITSYSEEELLGKHPRIMQSEKHTNDFYEKVLMDLGKTKEWKGEIWNRRKNGEVYPAWVLLNTITNSKGEIINYLGIVQDLTVFKENQENINWLSNYDLITGLPNQSLFRDMIRQERLKVDGTSDKFAILYLDIDNFKLINDAFGYSKGDQVLADIATRIQNLLKQKYILSRLSADEYGLILTDIKTSGDVEIKAKEIINLFKIPFEINKTEVLLTTSIGLVIYPDDISQEESLLNVASIALKHSKTLGKNTYSFYSKRLDRESSKRLKMDYHLRKALVKNELSLNYQPQVDIKTNEVIGVEALVRWNNPELGFISPGIFIPLAEENGMIIEFGTWILEKACEDTKLLHELGFKKINISVNLSVLQLKQNGFIESVNKILEKTKFDPKYLEFEITEGFLLENEKENREKLEKIKEAGIKISIDDFGTGFSSLGYLKKFSFDKIKIDQSFIRNIPNKEDENISKTIIQLANNLGLTVIAEGVETKIQYEFLKENKCDEIQGYFFSKPLSYADLINYLLKGHKTVLQKEE